MWCTTRAAHGDLADRSRSHEQNHTNYGDSDDEHDDAAMTGMSCLFFASTRASREYSKCVSLFVLFAVHVKLFEDQKTDTPHDDISQRSKERTKAEENIEKEHEE